MIALNWATHPPQHEILMSQADELAFMGGFGAGKTWLGVRWIIAQSLANPSDVPSLFVEPTWRMIKRVAVPEFKAAFEASHIPYKLHKSDWVITWGDHRREIWLASGEVPENLSGQTVGAIVQDEPAIQSEETQPRLVSRLRHPKAVVRRHLKTGTHEGLGWVHQLCQQRMADGSPRLHVVTASTYDNKSLPGDFITRMEAQFTDPARRKMYVLGLATSLKGSIYTNFRSDVHVRRCDNPAAGEIITGWDFNVRHMVTVVAIKYAGPRLHFIGEVVSEGGTTTDKHAARVADYLRSLGLAHPGVARRSDGQFREGLWAANSSGMVTAVIDASGRNAHSSAHDSDAVHVARAGFLVRHGQANPLVYDRIANVESWLGRVHVLFDPMGCPRMIKALQEHSYKDKSDPPMPQKDWRTAELPLDHYNDASGYVMCHVDMLARRGHLAA